MNEPTNVLLGQHRCHSLKTWPEFFCHVLTGAKLFEIRKDDRQFAAGDFVWLREWCPTEQAYTQRSVVKRVGYVITGEQVPGLSDGYAAFSISGVVGDVGEQVKAKLLEFETCADLTAKS